MQSAIERMENALTRIDRTLDAAPAPAAAGPSVDREKVAGALRALDGLIAELKAAPHA